MADEEAIPCTGWCKILILLFLVVLYVPAMILKRHIRLSTITNLLKFCLALLLMACVIYTMMSLLSASLGLAGKRLKLLVQLSLETETEMSKVDMDTQELKLSVDEIEALYWRDF